MQRDKRNLKQFWSDQPSGSLQSNPLPKAGLTPRPEQAAQHLLLVGSEPIKHKDPPSFPGPIPELHHSNGKTSAAKLPLLKLPLAFPTCPSDTATREAAADSKMSPLSSLLQLKPTPSASPHLSCASVPATRVDPTIGPCPWGSPKWTQHIRCDLLSTTQGQTHTSLPMPAALVLTQPSVGLVFTAATSHRKFCQEPCQGQEKQHLLILDPHRQLERFTFSEATQTVPSSLPVL